MSLDNNQTPTVTHTPERYKVVGFDAHPTTPPVTTTPPVVSNVEKPADETPKPRRTRARKTPNQAVYLKLPADLVKSLKLMALAEDRTQSDIAAEALKEFVGEWVSPYRKNSAAA